MKKIKKTAKLEKKALLQKAALQTFNKLGYHETRIEDIALKAKTGKGTFYLYFQSKEDLVHSLFDDFLEKFNQLHAWVSKNLHSNPNIGEVYSEEGKVIIQILEENRDLGLFLLKEGRSVSPEINKRLSEFISIQEKQATQSYKTAQKLGLMGDIDPKYAALCVVGGILHIYTLWLEGKVKDSPEVMLKKTLEFYLQALLK